MGPVPGAGLCDRKCKDESVPVLGEAAGDMLRKRGPRLVMPNGKTPLARTAPFRGYTRHVGVRIPRLCDRHAVRPEASHLTPLSSQAFPWYKAGNDRIDPRGSLAAPSPVPRKYAGRVRHCGYGQPPPPQPWASAVVVTASARPWAGLHRGPRALSNLLLSFLSSFHRFILKMEKNARSDSALLSSAEAKRVVL